MNTIDMIRRRNYCGAALATVTILTSLNLLADEKEQKPAELVVSLTTKLGVGGEVAAIDSNGEPYHVVLHDWDHDVSASNKDPHRRRVRIAQANGAYVMVPWRLIKEIHADGRAEHRLVLNDGSEYKGRLETEIVTQDRRYPLASLAMLRVVSVAPSTSKVEAQKGNNYTLHAPPLLPREIRVKFLGLLNGFGRVLGNFKLLVNDEVVEGNLLDFDRFSLASLEGEENWNLAVQAKGPEIVGKLITPYGGSAYNDWAFAFEDGRGVRFVFVKPTIGFSAVRVKDE